ncbi:MAG: phosphate acyltransferase PlsX [Hyphomonadaceae bacterium]
MSEHIVLSIEAMGGDAAPEVVIEGLAVFCAERDGVDFLLHGDETRLKPFLDRHPDVAARCEVRHTEIFVRMEDKPSQALRKARGSSMWNAVNCVKSGEAHAAVSAGNTGALMAISILSLRKMAGVHRPGMTALWPTMRGGTSVVLDVGANLEADAAQLVTFAIMGEAYARAVTGKARPTVGLLNIGTEDSKGHGHLKVAAAMLAREEIGLSYHGYVEGDDISAGTVDVVVTDGFSGNVALKTAEGTARLVGSYLKEAFTGGTINKAGAVLASAGLKRLREKMNPSNVNGGVLLGLNGVVVKSHGGTDPNGYATAVQLAANLAKSNYKDEVAAGLNRIAELSEEANLETDE